MTQSNRRTCSLWSEKKRFGKRIGNCIECNSALLKYQQGKLICSKCGLIQDFHHL